MNRGVMDTQKLKHCEPTLTPPRSARLKILLSAYACEPDKGSEPAVGWNMAQTLSLHHDVWVITRANNREGITGVTSSQSAPHLHFSYFDLPRWAAWWKSGRSGVLLYYYIWQLAIYFVARRLHQRVEFDIVHHVTFAKYWAPSFLVFLPVPFVWGPVGGGESTPGSFISAMSWRGRLYEKARVAARRLAELDPFVRFTAKRCAAGLATTTDTAMRMKHLGARSIDVVPAIGLSLAEIDVIDSAPTARNPETVKFVSLGNLLTLKGFDLGIRAFAEAELANADLWIIGDGPERRRLEAIAASKGLQGSVRFLGSMSRLQALRALAECDALVHPSLHDSGGYVCLEAMAAGIPVICLDLGGPAVLVSEESGIRIKASTPEQAVRDLKVAMQRLASDKCLRTKLGSHGRRAAISRFSWTAKMDTIEGVYRTILF